MTTPTCSTCLHFDRRCGCCNLTGEPRQPGSVACMEHTNGKMNSDRNANAHVPPGAERKEVT